MLQVKLRVMQGSSSGKEIPVPMTRFLIGRADECHLRPKSDAISRTHCTILLHDDEVLLRDLNSRNGTYLNEERVTADIPVRSGDKLRIGKLEFEFVIKQERKVAVPDGDTKQEKKAGESSSVEFDVTEWLEEANSVDKLKRSDPDTRQFKLDETDRVALEAAAAKSAESTGDSAERKLAPDRKSTPGKLPERAKQGAVNSREAAADMLKKFFNNR